MEPNALHHKLSQFYPCFHSIPPFATPTISNHQLTILSRKFCSNYTNFIILLNRFWVQFDLFFRCT